MDGLRQEFARPSQSRHRSAPRRRSAAELIRRRDGHATWQELKSQCTQHELRRALAEGEVIRVGRGRYALPDQNPARELAAAAGGVLSHLSAAVHLGLAVLRRPDVVHITVPSAAHRSCPPGAVLHRTDLADHERDRRSTDPLRTVIDCVATLPFAEALAVADSALRVELVRPEELHAASERFRGRGAVQLRRVAGAADGDAANPFESALRALLLDAGLTSFVPQQPVLLVTGGRVHADLGDRRRLIAIEADSFEHHGSRGALRADCRRYDEMTRAGWTVLRFAWEHVVGDPQWIVAVVQDVCSAADRRLAHSS